MYTVLKFSSKSSAPFKTICLHFNSFCHSSYFALLRIFTLIFTHLHCLYLQKRIPFFTSNILCHHKHFSSNTLPVIFLQNSHNIKFQSIFSSLLQTQKSNIFSILSSTNAYLFGTLFNILFSAFHFKPIR